MRLSPAAHVGEELLHHEGFAPDLLEHFHQRGQVGVVPPDLEHRRPGVAVERLDDDVAVARAEVRRRVEATRHQRRRHQVRVAEHEQLFGRVPDLGRIVDHQSLARDALEQMCRGDVRHVERRVLPHQHDIGVVSEVERLRLSEPAEMRARLTRHAELARQDAHPPGLEVERRRAVVPQPIPPRLRR